MKRWLSVSLLLLIPVLLSMACNLSPFGNDSDGENIITINEVVSDYIVQVTPYVPPTPTLTRLPTLTPTPTLSPTVVGGGGSNGDGTGDGTGGDFGPQPNVSPAAQTATAAAAVTATAPPLQTLSVEPTQTSPPPATATSAAPPTAAPTRDGSSLPPDDDDDDGGDDDNNDNNNNNPPTATAVPPTATATPPGTGNPPLPGLSFVQTNYTVFENDGLVTLVAQLSQTSVSTVSVTYATSDGSASSTEYAPTTGQLIFPPNTLSQTIDITLFDDTLTNEAPLAFTVALSNPVNATLGATSTVTVTIADDEVPPTVRLTSWPSVVPEVDAPISYTLSLSALSAVTVTAEYSTNDGTATTPGDYTAVSGVAVFPPGTTDFGFGSTILDDTATEGNEFFTVSVLDPLNATLASFDTVVTTTITDDDDRFIYITSRPGGGGGSIYRFSALDPTVDVGNPACTNPNEFVCDGSAGLSEPHDLVIGPDGHLYVTSWDGTNGHVLRFDINTGAPLPSGTLCPQNADAFICGVPELDRPRGLAFSPVGPTWYVASGDSDEIFKYNNTGQLQPGACSPSVLFCDLDGLDEPSYLRVVGGQLYVANRGNDAVLRFNETPFPYYAGTGACTTNPPPVLEFTGFVCDTGGAARGLHFDTGGNLFVINGEDGELLRFDGTDGTPLPNLCLGSNGAVVCGLDNPTSFDYIGPDGDLLILNGTGNKEVLRYDSTTAALEVFIPTSAGLEGSQGIVVGP